MLESESSRDEFPLQPGKVTRSRGEQSGNPSRGAAEASRPDEQFLGGDQIEGFHAVRELLRARRRNVREVWVVERATGALEIEELAQSIGIRVRHVAPARLEEFARGRESFPAAQETFQPAGKFSG